MNYLTRDEEDRREKRWMLFLLVLWVITLAVAIITHGLMGGVFAMLFTFGALVVVGTTQPWSDSDTFAFVYVVAPLALVGADVAMIWTAMAR